MTGGGYEAAVRSWAAHLTAGGATGWREWLSDGPASRPAPVEDLAGPLPGAAQLELVRRLATSPGAGGVERFAGLADRVLATSAPGRGPGELPLVWPPAPGQDEAARGGFPAVDPAALGPEELLRACVGALAGLLQDVARRPPTPTPRRWLPRFPGRRAFAVHGSPLLAEEVRASLRSRGLVEGGRRAVHLVLVAPFDQMMAEHWVRRTRNGSDIAWPRLWQRAMTGDRVPPAIAVDGIAARLAAHAGTERVRLLVAVDAADAADLAAEALGLGRRGQRVGAPPLDVVSAELMRRLNGVLRLRVDPEQRRQLAATVLPQVVGHTGGGRLAPPRGRGRWGRATADVMASRIAAAGYPVLGDLRIVVPAPVGEARRTVDPDAVLDLGLAALARAWSLLVPTATKER